ncbi:hypothetical protein MTP16_14005 [Hymenobacter monticola]|uniref:Uncharacterized protein n=2 Tax=Hymenobacter monticola TaxID=1705399 RepID=A0ABY4B0B4_9BACT|nr:hypothetical protein [Hymenobacter monticola]UOE32244.1 hypothetical protein MTP16_14005 [Hymenobacter monticola]
MATSAADTLTPEMLALLRRFDFAPLWSGQRSETTTPVLDGFFGDEHRRISFVFAKIVRDSTQPQLFYVRGKNKFRQAVTPFSGIIRITTLVDLPGHGFLDMDSAASEAYTAKARFTFLEQPGASGTGTFTGTAFLDFFIDGDGELRIGQTVMNPDTTAPARGAGVLYRGTWTSAARRQAKPIVIANDVLMVAPEMLPQFGMGERNAQINPKYARLGWTEMWENDEWWAASPKPKLSL